MLFYEEAVGQLDLFRAVRLCCGEGHGDEGEEALRTCCWLLYTIYDIQWLHFILQCLRITRKQGATNRGQEEQKEGSRQNVERFSHKREISRIHHCVDARR